MGDYLLKRWQKGLSRLKGIKRTRKNSIIIGSLVLVLSTGLFFYHFSGTQAAVRKAALKQEIDPEVLDPLNKIGKGLKKENKQLCQMAEKPAVKAKEEKTIEKKVVKLPENLDPLHKIGKGYLKDLAKNKSSDNGEGFDTAAANNAVKDKMLTLVGGYPIEAMVDRLSEKSAKVSSFVVAIAKKESDWGKHVPTKNGRDCFNYWGYKGSYNLTDSGYSCFDNLEQAVDVVSGRIAELIDKKVDTPEKMVVWKCGSSCAGHDPAGVAKWIADVRMYKTKLN